MGGAGAALGRVAAAISPAARRPQPTQMKLYVEALLSNEPAARDSASLTLARRSVLLTKLINVNRHNKSTQSFFSSPQSKSAQLVRYCRCGPAEHTDGLRGALGHFCVLGGAVSKVT